MAAIPLGANGVLTERIHDGRRAFARRRHQFPGFREEDERTMTTAYCVKHKGKIEMKDAKRVTMKNGKPAWQGVCPQDGTKVFRIGA